jgi:YggT family protein
VTFSIAELLANVVNYAYYILLGFIIVWILFGWFGRYPSNELLQRVYDIVHNVVNPIMMPLRERLPPLRIGGIAMDLSPIIALIGLFIARRLLLIIIENFVRPVTG